MNAPILNKAVIAAAARSAHRRRVRHLAAGGGLAALGLIAFLYPVAPNAGPRDVAAPQNWSLAAR